MGREVYTRHFDTKLEFRTLDGVDDGRTLYGRIVPYGEVITFHDVYDNGKLKSEQFSLGALADAARAWSRIKLNFEHQPGFTNQIGYGQHCREAGDGGWATFRIYEAEVAKVREMVNTMYDGFSLEFMPVRTRIDDAGVLVREKVHVVAVALTTQPAYADAMVVGMRSQEAAPLTGQGDPLAPYRQAITDGLLTEVGVKEFLSRQAEQTPPPAAPNLAAALAILAEVNRSKT